MKEYTRLVINKPVLMGERYWYDAMLSTDYPGRDDIRYTLDDIIRWHETELGNSNAPRLIAEAIRIRQEIFAGNYRRDENI